MVTPDNMNDIYNENLDHYRRLVKTIPGIELKGAKVLYTSLNGHMFSYLEKDGSLAFGFLKKQEKHFLKNTGLHCSFHMGSSKRNLYWCPMPC